jgi:hypothetical protein
MAEGRWIEAKRKGRCVLCKNEIAVGAEIWLKSAGVAYCHDCGILAENMPHEYGPLESSVMKELAKLPMEAGEGTLAQSMLFLAAQLDEGDVPPRERPQYTKELRISLLSLQDAYPATDTDDETETARQKRERRAREAGGY